MQSPFADCVKAIHPCQMNRFISAFAVALVLALTAFRAQAAVVLYPAFTTNVVFPGSAANSLLISNSVSIVPDHRYIDPDIGTPDSAASRYFGGSVDFSSVGDEWGAAATFTIGGAGEDAVFRAGGGVTNWVVSGSASAATTPLNRSSAFDFVIKLEDTAWNNTAIKLFLGTNANAATEGTADFTVNINNANSSNPLNFLSWSFTHESWNTEPATLDIDNIFSATDWTPVSAIPEPGTVMLLSSGLGILLWAQRRRR